MHRSAATIDETPPRLVAAQIVIHEENITLVINCRLLSINVIEPINGA
jgi:hypothetical protein